MCKNVDPARNCNTWNPLGGECQTCPTEQHVLTGGSCVIPPTCKPE